MAVFRLLSLCMGFSLAAALLPGNVMAGDRRGSHVALGQNEGSVSYSATINTGRQGVWIQVRGRGSYSGSYVAPTGAPGVSLVSAPGRWAGYGSNGSGAGSTTTTDITRSWHNAQGEPYYQTADGQVYHLGMLNIGQESSGKDGWFTVGSRQHPGSIPEGLYIGGTFQGIVWVPQGGSPANTQLTPAPPVAPAGAASAPVVIDPRAVAMTVLQHVPLPGIQVRMNPSLGLVGLPGWFWAAGYTGEPFGGSATVGSFTVAVQVQPVSYTWNFGDGTALVSKSLGHPYPAESDVQHTYQFSSLHHPNGFPVQLVIQFTASYSVNGGPTEPLSGMVGTYTADYPVQELQSILTNR